MIFVGFSGGVDSVVLLHKLKQQHNQITAIHVNHHISKNSDRWETFCREFCHAHDIHFIAAPVYMEVPSETEARKHRYKAYRECCSEIYLAHHSDDDVETMMFKMIRGCGLTGLTGLKDVITYDGLTIHRPLLKTTKEEIYHYATNHGLSWVTDESNSDTSYSRNYLRNKIIPAIKGKFPAFTTNMMRMKENVQEADALLMEIALEDMKQTDMVINNIKQLSPTRRRNLIRFYIKTTVGNLPPAHQFNEFVRQIETFSNGKKPKITLCGIGIGVHHNRLSTV